MPEPTKIETSEPFFVGYMPTMPAPVARTVRWSVAIIFGLAIALIVAFVISPKPFAAATFEYGTVRAFEGIIRLAPSPLLELARPGLTEAPSQYHLVAFGKRGAGEQVAPFDGQRVSLRGTLVFRAGMTMIELEAGSIEAAGSAVVPVSIAGESLGRMTLVGEIVDSKCHWGVMKPGAGKPHRACAVRCISGGVPPMLLLRDADGPARWMLLVGPDGASIGQQVLPFVAEPLEVTGTVTRQGDWWILAADPATFRRLL